MATHVILWIVLFDLELSVEATNLGRSVVRASLSHFALRHRFLQLGDNRRHRDRAVFVDLFLTPNGP